MNLNKMIIKWDKKAGLLWKLKSNIFKNDFCVKHRCLTIEGEATFKAMFIANKIKKFVTNPIIGLF